MQVRTMEFTVVVAAGSQDRRAIFLSFCLEKAPIGFSAIGATLTPPRGTKSSPVRAGGRNYGREFHGRAWR